MKYSNRLTPEQNFEECNRQLLLAQYEVKVLKEKYEKNTINGHNPTTVTIDKPARLRVHLLS